MKCFYGENSSLREEENVKITFIVRDVRDIEDVDALVDFLSVQNGFKQCVVSVETLGISVPLDGVDPEFLHMPRECLGEQEFENRITNYLN